MSDEQHPASSPETPAPAPASGEEPSPAPAEEPQAKKKKHPWLWVLLGLLILSLGAWDGQLLGLWTIVPEPTPLPPLPAPRATPEPGPSPTPEPLFTVERGYLLCEDGLFYPEEPLTRATAAEILRLAGCSVEDEGDPAAPLSEEALLSLAAAAAPEAAANAMEAIRGLGDEMVTRAEAAVFFNRLFGLPGSGEERVYFPDAAPDYWAWAEIQTAGQSAFAWPGEDGRLEEGFFTRDGWLYLADENGYLRKNCFEGSLRFGPDGRYSSGSQELDGYVAAMLRMVTEEGMSREDMLRAAYLYIRDNFDYLMRHYYRIGDTGWALQEALTMYSTGRGNCYCYAAAFWAAARQLGYQAKIVSGTYGSSERAPHGWVEIIQEDGSRLTYDVEIEMVMRTKRERGDMYALTDGRRSVHAYVEQGYKDDLIPRFTNEGLLPE